MRHALLLIYLILLSFSGYSQVEWEELTAHNAEAVELLFVSQEDHFIGEMRFPNRYVISKDMGDTWEIFIDFDSIDVESYSLADWSLSQDNKGDYYITSKEKLYKFNESIKELDLVLDNVLPNQNTIIWEYHFLPNGNIIVGSEALIRLYSPSGELLQSHILEGGSFDILIGEDDLHYIILDKAIDNDAYDLISFNSDFSQFSEAEPFIHFSTRNFSLYDGVFYSNRGYSYDGINWIVYENGIVGNHQIGNEGILYLFNYDSFYVSLDGGISFVIYEYPDFIEIDYPRDFYTLSSGGFLLQDFEYSNGHLWYTEDYLDWSSIVEKFELGLPFSFEVEVGIENNIFVRAGDEFKFYSNQEVPDWQEFETDTSDIRHNLSSRLYALPNGSLINRYGCYSFNQGEDWECILGGASSIISKAGVLYSGEGTRRSFDFGLTWDRIHDYPSGDNQTSVHFDAIDQSGTIYYTVIDGPILASGGVLTYKYRKEVDRNREEIAPWSIMPSATAYSGEELYHISRSSTNVRFTRFFHDQYYNTYTVDLPFDGYASITVDHLDNIYLYSSNMILMSQDRGDSWKNITPDFSNLISINDIEIGYDNHIYVATTGTPILKSKKPLVDAGKIKVTVYEDLNDNCTYDNNEKGIPGIKVGVGDRIAILPTDSNGETSIVLPLGDYQIEALLRNDLYSSCDNDYVVILDENNTEEEITIPIKIIDECADVEIGASIPFLRRCFDNTYNFDFYNDGSADATNVIVHVTLDEYFEYISSDQELVSIDGLVYSFNIGDLAPSERKRGLIRFKLSCDAELRQAHYISADIEYDNPCNNLLGDITTFECQENVGSFDPNDKTSIINGFTNKEIVEEKESVEYKIRFQNTGTDTAFTVRIEDPLVSYFDINSVEPIAASHDYTWSIEKSKLIVTFDDIKLVDSTRNEEASHGFIKFKAVLNKDNLDPGDLITNRALIYFDFNEPIITNTVENYYICEHTYNSIDTTICPNDSYEGYSDAGVYLDDFVTALGCDSTRVVYLTVLEPNDPLCMTISIDDNLESDYNIKIYPNPSNELFNIKSDNETLKEIEVYDVNGHRLNAVDIVSTSKISLKDYPVGLYFIKIRLDGESYFYSKIIKQ